MLKRQDILPLYTLSYIYLSYSTSEHYKGLLGTNLFLSYRCGCCRFVDFVAGSVDIGAVGVVDRDDSGCRGEKDKLWKQLG